uniref:EamA domain-containing protein n=1 Tax=Strombidinopsis acuminata TaxID=141414 RepID=A0A7S3TRG1_9SPIT
MATSRRQASTALSACVLILGAYGFLDFAWCARAPAVGVQPSLSRFTGPALAVDSKPARLSHDRTGLLARGGEENSAAKAYTTGISWYLMHFIVSIGNDGIMKFLGSSLPPFQIVFLRFLTAALVLLPVAITKGSEAFKTQRLWMHGVRGSLLALGIGLWCRGLAIMPFASCVVINNTMPFFKMLFAMLILGENVGKQRWIASIGGFIGCLIVFNPTAATFQPESLVLILSACCFAMLDIMNKKYAFEESIVSMLFYGSIATAIVSAYTAFTTWVPVQPMQYLLFAALGMGANALLYCLLKAFQYVDASATCPYRYTEFVLSAIVGLLLFREKPMASTLLGSAIILPSVIYCAYIETKPPAEKKEEAAASAAPAAA